MTSAMNIDERRTYVIGDIHGALRALIQCLERAQFSYTNDHLICLGDVVDGWPESKQCINELCKIDHLTYIMGNHDWWALKSMQGEPPDLAWLQQGGEETLKSYDGKPDLEHKDFFLKSLPYYLVDNKLFVHAGIDPEKSLEQQNQETFYWDRELAKAAIDASLGKKEIKLTNYDEVYIGHTPISRLGILHPLRSNDVWLMDTGAGWDGVLSIMNIETKEYFTSDAVPFLYPKSAGRDRL